MAKLKYLPATKEITSPQTPRVGATMKSMNPEIVSGQKNKKTNRVTNTQRKGCGTVKSMNPETNSGAKIHKHTHTHTHKMTQIQNFTGQ